MFCIKSDIITLVECMISECMNNSSCIDGHGLDHAFIMHSDDCYVILCCMCCVIVCLVNSI